MTRSVLPAAVLADLEVDDVARYISDGEEAIALFLALPTVETYLAEAAVQQARIQRAHRTLRRHFEQLQQAAASEPVAAKMRNRSRSQASPFCAVHHYLTCWRIVGRHLLAIRDICKLREVGLALRSHMSTFRKYENMRDHYEHFDERLPGRRNVGRLRVRNDLGNLFGNTLSVGGERIDIGPQSMRLLSKIIRDVFHAFKVGAIEKLATEDPGRLRGLVATIRVKRIDRAVRRMFPVETAQQSPGRGHGL